MGTSSIGVLSGNNYLCQYTAARPSLSNLEKLVYLQQSLRDGSAREVIEGLSRSSDNYAEAIKCLQSRYDRPRLIHQTYVRMILDAPALKDGTGKELRCLHNTVRQLLRALKAMGYKPSGPFITSVLELKLDTKPCLSGNDTVKNRPTCPITHHRKQISGIAGLSHRTPLQLIV